MNISILYFASLSDDFDLKKESLSLDQDHYTVEHLKKTLSLRGDIWQQKINDINTRCAVNQVLADNTTVITDNSEIAFFPPVTGG